MPAANPGNRLAMEAALPPAELDALRDQCRRAGIPLDGWHHIPGLCETYELAAVTALAERLREETGGGWKTACDAAAIRVGLSPDTLATRLKRWPEYAYRRAA